MTTLPAIILSTLFVTTLPAALVATTAFGQEGPGRGEVEIKDIVVNGSGCPVGTAMAVVTNSTKDGPIDSGYVIFDEFNVENPGKERKFCNLAIDLKFPQGWSYTLTTVEAAGYAEIQRGVTAKITFEMAFRGTSAKSKLVSQQKGYWEGSYHLVKHFPATVWSPCGKVLPLNLKYTATLSGKAKTEDTSILVLGNEAAKHPFAIRWRRC